VYTKTFFTTGLFLSLLFSSCSQKEGCRDINATNYDKEAEKDCNNCCLYEEVVIDARDAFLGAYTITDTSYVFGNIDEIKTYVLTITKNGDQESDIFLSNLINSGANYEATLNVNDGIFSIPSQQVSGPYLLSGSGMLSNDKISYQTSGDVYINKGAGSK